MTVAVPGPEVDRPCGGPGLGARGRDRHLPGRSGDVPRLVGAAPAQADAGGARRADLGQVQSRAGDGPLRARARRRGAAHRAHRPRLGARAAVAACLRQPGHLPRGGAAARPHPPRHVLRRRRLAFAHRRRVRRLHVRHRQHRDAGRGGHRRDLAARAADHRHALVRAAGRGRLRQGHDAGHDRALRHERRRLPGRGVHGRCGARAVDAGAHDPVQHERRARRADRAGRAR